MCSPCKKRADGGSGSSSKHKQKVSYLNQGLCACGRPRGHAFDPVCSVGGTVAYVSRIGEGKVPAREWVPRAINITKGVIQCASGDEVNGVITLALEERKAAGDPNAAKYERMWGLCTCGDGGAPPEAFDEVVTYVAESAEEEGFDKAEEELEAWLEQRMEQHSRRHHSHGRHNRARGHRRAAAEY